MEVVYRLDSYSFCSLNCRDKYLTEKDDEKKKEGFRERAFREIFQFSGGVEHGKR